MGALCDKMFYEAQVLIPPIADDPKLTAIEISWVFQYLCVVE